MSRKVKALLFYSALALIAGVCIWKISSRNQAEKLAELEEALRRQENAVVQKRFEEGEAIDRAKRDRNDKSSEAQLNERDAKSKAEYDEAMRGIAVAKLGVEEKRALAEAKGDAERAAVRLIYEQKRTALGGSQLIRSEGQ